MAIHALSTARSMLVVAPFTAGMLGVLAAGLGWLSSSRPLHALAQPGDALDTDGDGLIDAQEEVLGTDPALADTDGDGFSDLEELARQSSPVDPHSRPGNDVLSIGLTARGEGGALRLLMAIYYEDGRHDNKAIGAGMLRSGMLSALPFQLLAGRSRTKFVTTGSGEVMVLDVALPASLFRPEDRMSFYAAVGFTGRAGYASADVIEVWTRQDVPLLKVDVPVTGSAAMSAYVAGAVYRPIPFNGVQDIPSQWEPARICFRTSATIGSRGGMLTQEIISSECIDDWDSYCEAGCENATGHVYTTIDPYHLVGG